MTFKIIDSGPALPSINTGVTGGSVSITSGRNTSAGTGGSIVITEVKTAQHPKAIKIKFPDGSTAMECVRCERQTQHAESNQENGTFICYGCRNGI
jgi:hypothetical protein